jgi:hypothetical protein
VDRQWNAGLLEYQIQDVRSIVSLTMAALPPTELASTDTSCDMYRAQAHGTMDVLYNRYKPDRHLLTSPSIPVALRRWLS